MTRKTMVELLAEINALFPDNAAGEITPADLRQFCTDFVESVSPAYAVLAQLTNNVRSLTTAPALLPWGEVYAVQNPEWTADAANGWVQRDGTIHTSRLTLNIDCEGAANRLVTATLYKNDVPTPFRATALLQGAGKPVTLTMATINYSDVTAKYQIYVQADSATSVTFFNGTFIGENVPVRTA